MIENKIIKQTKEGLEFNEDYEFSSPSTAAAVVMGRNANGLKEWKLGSGISLKEHETM